jgi:hypothetical protein
LFWPYFIFLAAFPCLIIAENWKRSLAEIDLSEVRLS